MPTIRPGHPESAGSPVPMAETASMSGSDPLSGDALKKCQNSLFDPTMQRREEPQLQSASHGYHQMREHPWQIFSWLQANSAKQSMSQDEAHAWQTLKLLGSEAVKAQLWCFGRSWPWWLDAVSICVGVNVIYIYILHMSYVCMCTFMCCQFWHDVQKHGFASPSLPFLFQDR